MFPLIFPPVWWLGILLASLSGSLFFLSLNILFKIFIYYKVPVTPVGQIINIPNENEHENLPMYELSEVREQCVVMMNPPTSPIPLRSLNRVPLPSLPLPSLHDGPPSYKSVQLPRI